jgi:two-component system CheB/CheR fusion protein
VVGLGGSADGLEELEQFFSSTPEDTGMAYVLVTHIDADDKALSPERIQRATKMPVRLIQDGARPLANTVYVIPPNRRLLIEDNMLRLGAPGRRSGARNLIDTFFISLAHERGQAAIGVVLSGAGSDGAAGLRAIKESGGAALVQEPSSAALDAMPLAALGAVVPDGVAGPAQLPAKIAATIGRRRPADRTPEAATDGEAAARALERVLGIVHERTGHDVAQYKRSALERRLDQRLALHQLADLDAYADFLDGHPEEAELLAGELLVGLTHFFRDAHAFDVLRDQALPALLASRTDIRTVRAWVAGCSSGEEAYSLAIVLHEVLAKLGKSDVRVQINATDIDEGAIAIASAGRYSDEIEQHVAHDRLSRHFVREEHGYRIKKPIRDSVVFTTHDLVNDPPFRHLDVLSCRNVLALLPTEQQSALLSRFRTALTGDGLLILGETDAAASARELFAPVGTKAKIFRARP